MGTIWAALLGIVLTIAAIVAVIGLAWLYWQVAKNIYARIVCGGKWEDLTSGQRYNAGDTIGGCTFVIALVLTAGAWFGIGAFA